MKIIFDSEEQKEIILKAISKTDACPSDVGMDNCCNAVIACEECWKNAIECEVLGKS